MQTRLLQPGWGNLLPPSRRRRQGQPTTTSSSFSSARSEILGFRYSKEEGCIQIPDATISYTSEIPDDCLSRRWLLVEGESRHRLALNANSGLVPFNPSNFSRFDSVTKLSLRCDRRSVSIDDNGLISISLRCLNLTRLKLCGCREITYVGMAALAKTCKGLKKFSCGSCMFGAKGMNALLDNCSSLEELSVKRLRGINDGVSAEPIGPGTAAMSLKSVCLKELYNGQFFGPLITGAKKLKTLKLLRFNSLDQINNLNCLDQINNLS